MSADNSSRGLKNALAKLRADGVDELFCAVFERFYHILESKQSDYIRESDVEPIANMPKFNDNDRFLTSGLSSEDTSGKVSELVKKTCIVKLNGGLGTTMGLCKAKSLLPVKDNLTFLDIIVRQVEALRLKHRAKFPLLFMNSFSTSDDTMNFLHENYRAFDNCTSGGVLPQEFLQHHEPKLLASNLEPATFSEDPRLEWCPPGHGDFYSAFHASGVLKQYVNAGIKYAFVSNSDNLGAVFDERLLEHFASTGATVMLELTEKTAADIKGGHIVKIDGKNVLREVAQIHPDDLVQALDSTRHPYFNTNSLWFDLEHLYKTLQQKHGVLELPLIANHKRLRPKDDSTPEVIQMESAIGAGITALDKTAVVAVPRSRFLPVKTRDDLDLLHSSEYQLDASYHLRSTKNH